MTPYLYPDEGPVAFRRDRDLGDVIRVSIEWMRETAGTWIPAVLAIAGPLYGVGSVLGGFASPASGVSVLAVLVNGIAGLFMSSVVFGIIRRYRVAETELSVGGVWEEAKEWIWPQVGFGMLTAFFVFLALLPFGVIFAVAGAEDASVLMIFGYGLALLVLAVFAAPYYILGLASRIIDEDSAVDAYRRAAGLVRSHRWLATGTSLVIYGMIYFIAGVFGGGLQALLMAIGGEVGVLAAIGSLLATAVLVPASVFGAVASVFLFETLVEREEGTQLDADIEAIRDEGAVASPRLPVVPPPPAPELEAPDTRGFAERLREDRPVDHDASSGSEPQRGGFRGGGFEDDA